MISNEVTDSTDITDSHQQQGCCSLLRAEFGLSLFSIQETNDKTIDLQRTFSPSPKWGVCLVKIFLTGWALQVLIGDLLSYHGDTKTRSFWMAYLTHWALTFAEFYLVLSLLRQFLTPDPNNTLSWFTKLLWGLYVTAMTLQESVTLLYWLVEYDPSLESVKYYGFMKHGGIMIICLVEGLIVNRVPLRIKQLIFPFTIAVLYLIWTLIHDFLLRVGNPSVNNTDGDDDAIYKSLSWKNRPRTALISSILIIIFLVPILFLSTYLLSIKRRRYVQDEASEQQFTAGDIDEEDLQERPNNHAKAF